MFIILIFIAYFGYENPCMGEDRLFRTFTTFTIFVKVNLNFQDGFLFIIACGYHLKRSNEKCSRVVGNVLKF